MIVTGWVAMAADYHVTITGNDTTGDGSGAFPWRTIQKAADSLGVGDTCFIHSGTYHERVTLTNLNGTSSEPITFAAYPNATVTLDGTQPVTALQTNAWTQHSGNIYRTGLSNDVWQLFVDGEMMIPARWPNAFLHDASIWDQESTWAQGDETSSTNGTEVDAGVAGVDLAASGLNMSNALAILNIASFRTYTRRVTSHAAGSGAFNFETIPANAYRTKLHYYFFERKLDLLDAEREWFYDSGSMTLYLWSPGGGTPSGDIRGKTETYAFDISNSTYVVLRGLDFFGTAFRFYDCEQVTVEDCDLSYPSTSKRVLGITSGPETAIIDQPGQQNPSSCTIRNCTFENADSPAIFMAGESNRIENCSFLNIDFSGADLPNLMASIYMRGTGSVFRYNTLSTAGASETIDPGTAAVMEFNLMSRTGLFQSDGAIFHFVTGNQPGSMTRYNWIHDSVKMGVRFDGTDGTPTGSTTHVEGTMHHNVTWNDHGGLMAKGDRHYVYSNTGFDSGERNDIMIVSSVSTTELANVHSTTRNNAAERIAGHRTSGVGAYPVPGTNDHNWNGYVTGLDIRTQLRDADNLDFRPQATSALVDAGTNVSGITDGFFGAAPDLGAYEWNCTNYWIPGRKLTQASLPIPGDASTNAPGSTDLMWREGYRATSHDVYFGLSSNAVATAGHASPEFRGNQPNNIHAHVPLQAGTPYYWRVDAITAEQTVTGKVWHFAPASSTPPPAVYGTGFRLR